MLRNVSEFMFWFGVGKLVTAATVNICEGATGNITQIVLIVFLFNYAPSIGRSALIAAQLFRYNI
ncbi:hypothetical protein PMJGCIOK_00036 [Scale drop disease virus]|nr:hypothetical protein PMJGCIOK_00036 [Scale drop disease virus]